MYIIIIILNNALHRENASDFVVKAGSEIRSRGGTDYPVDQITIHPKYNSTITEYDVAVIRVKANFSFFESPN